MGTTKERGSNQNEEVRNRLPAPSLVLKNYGGDELNILKETSVKLERDGHSCTVLVLLQKIPSHDLLICTILLSVLGSQLIQKSISSESVDILTDKQTKNKEKTQTEGTTSQNTTDALLKVKLISAVQVPAHHERLVRGEVDMNSSSEMKMALFTVDDYFVKDNGIIMEEAVVEPDSNRFVILVLQNSACFSSCVS